jgi:hypothetical protein
MYMSFSVLLVVVIVMALEEKISVPCLLYNLFSLMSYFFINNKSVMQCIHNADFISDIFLQYRMH